jgi:5-methylcytosine-specific restriction endonuclease McrA
MLVDDLSKKKLAAMNRPRNGQAHAPSAQRIPSAVKREVWKRDGGQCGFVGTSGRCCETGFREFHHVVPFAAGGSTTVENIALRCRAHNRYEAGQYYGPSLPLLREKRSTYGTRSGPS